jgi:hypothetical protein
MSFDQEQADRDYDGILYERDQLKVEVVALRADVALATDTIKKCHAWIEEAKPLLARGGGAETELEMARLLLALAYAGPGFYHDDGELQDNTSQPAIDFKRDSIMDIKSKIEQRNLSKLQAMGYPESHQL